jgi:hypothetical protein
MKKINVIGHVYVPEENIKDFCNEINEIKADVNIRSEKLKINAKSVTSVLALNKRNLLIELIPKDMNDLRVFDSILTKYPTL